MIRRSPIKRSTTPLKRSPLARIGRKKNAKKTARAEVCRIVRDRDQWCMFTRMCQQNKIAFMGGEPDMCWGPSDVHEIVPRSVWPDGDLEPTNCILLCRLHHEWIDDHRPEALLIGIYSRTKP